jgi:CRP-like cAMP-binding protein
MNETKKYGEFIKNVLNRYHLVCEKSISSLLSISKIQRLKKGQMLLQIGKTSKQKHILYEGAVVSYYLNNDGNVYHKNIFLKGDFVGSMVSVLKNEPSKFALEVVEDTTLISFNYKKYRQLIEENKDLTDFYIAYLEKNWVVDKEKREIEIVLKEAKERYIDFIVTHPNIENRIPLQYIASHLGITATQLSRIRRNIKEKSS